MDRLIMLIATGCYSGYLPTMPGTWGTLVAFPLHFLLLRLPATLYLPALGLIFLLAVFTAGSAEKIVNHSDPGIIVIDEIIGMLVGLIGVPWKAAPLFCAFVLFRLFDIIKPFPVGWVDTRLHGGLGIVLDDVVAGIYTLLVMQGVKYILGW
ncbi:MAG: phosphatidylglycerophosphatase A [Thermodesulfobacteriota bacterium]